MDSKHTVHHDIRMQGFAGRITPADLRALVRQQVASLPVVCEALYPHPQRLLGRVLGKDVVARQPVPAFARAAMDGYALRGEDTFGATAYNPLSLALVGEVLAGGRFDGRVGPGQAVRIMTGAPVPAGADAVLMAEQTQEASPGEVLALGAVPPGKHVGQPGEDVQAGEVVLAAGRRLRPQDIGLLAALGVSEVALAAQPQVGLLMTGNELLPAGQAPQGSRIADSNGPMLAALVARDGGVPLPPLLVGDDPLALADALTHMPGDMLLVSGGTSVGQEDHLPQILATQGRLLAHGVAMRPGAPTGFGLLGGRPVFLLPGNPVACLVAYDFFAALALCLQGGLLQGWPYVSRSLPLGERIASQLGRLDYVRVRIEEGQAWPLAVSGAGLLSTTTRAQGFVLVPSNCEGWPAQTPVTVHLYETPPASPEETALD